MRKLLWLPLLLCMVWACVQNSPKNSGSNPDKVSEDLPETGPDATDLLRVIQGKWQNEQDPGYYLEIVDTDMKQYRNGQLTRESQIVVDGACTTLECKTDTTDLTDGWCFKEKSGNETVCRQVKSCDKTHLKFIMVGTHDLLSFVKPNP